MSAWQPIETAPKTSRAILIFVPHNQCIYCVTWRKTDDPAEREGWVVFGAGWRDHIQGASHWQPLPEPPASPERTST